MSYQGFDKRNWPELLPELVYGYNGTPHTTTGYSPYFLFFRKEPVLPVDLTLGTEIKVESSEDEWVTHHFNTLKETFVLATEKTERGIETTREIQCQCEQQGPTSWIPSIFAESS
jgi:hypothetical protein